MIHYALFFLLGILGVQQMAELPPVFVLPLLLIICSVTLWQRRWRLAGLLSGLLWALLFAFAKPQMLAAPLEGEQLTIRGTVIDLPVFEENRVKFGFRVFQPPPGMPERIRLSWYYPQLKIKSGQFWELSVKLKQPRGRYNPGTFDYEYWLFSQAYGATGYVRARPGPLLLQDSSLSYGWSVWRQTLADHLQQRLQNTRYPQLITALTIGERSGLSQMDWDILRQTGTAHLVAISGLHVGLVALLIYGSVLRLCVYSVKLASFGLRLAAVCAIFGAVIYAAFAGFSLPSRRAIIMLTVVLFAVALQRHVQPLRVLALALLAVLLFDPLAAASASFWLSFFAVFLIWYVLSGRLKPRKRWRSALMVHWVTALGLAPLLMFSFQQVSLIAPIANLIAVPIVSLLIVPLALMATVLLWMPVLAEFLFAVVDSLMHVLWQVLEFLNEMPVSAVNTHQPSVLAVCLAVIGIILLLAPKGVPGRYLGVSLCLPLLFPANQQPETGEVRMTLLDVGQGLSVIVETTNHVLVFDAGAKYSGRFDMGNAVVLPYLRFRGLSQLDMLMISHGDNDHKGGMQSIRNNIPVKDIVSGPSVLPVPSGGRPCVRGGEWKWDEVSFEVLAPAIPNVLKSDNDNSCVLKISARKQAFLLTGDIEWPAEDWLLQQNAEKLAADLLIAPHHGSHTSSSLAFLQAVDPDVVLIPAGYRNRFGFPHREVLQRYRALDIEWLNTALEGAIIVTTQKEQMEVKSSRALYGKYWNRF